LISHLGPFIMTFFIALFILLMQFVWKYIDDFVGKGLDLHIILELLLFASVSLVPMALPLAVLLSSIMTFGNLAEHYELVACKAAGISLGKVMRPLIIFSVFISVMAFFFSNYVLPLTNLKMDSLLYDVTHKKPALSIKEGAFYNGIEGYSIKVDKKDGDGSGLRGIMIYDHTDGQGNTKVTLAESGKMLMSEDERYLLVTLYNGRSYEDRTSGRNIAARPFLRTSFNEQTIRFDLSAFRLTRTNEDLFKDHSAMLNIRQLNEKADTFRLMIQKRKRDYLKNVYNFYSLKRDSLNKLPLVETGLSGTSYIANFPVFDRTRMFDIALSQARNLKSYVYSSSEDISISMKTLYRNRIEWHMKFTLSFACLVLFFIGAPLGAIIKKGGLGMPVVVSTLFFVFFHILSITGKKFAQEGVINVAYGMWMASAVLMPIGIFLTIKAISDSSLFEIDNYLRRLKRIFRR
jgi:lipopolysaccharide export system permease protein